MGGYYDRNDRVLPWGALAGRGVVHLSSVTLGQEPAPVVQDGCVVAVLVHVDTGEDLVLIGAHDELPPLWSDRTCGGTGGRVGADTTVTGVDP